MPVEKPQLVLPGTMCQPDDRKAGTPTPHLVQSMAHDAELMAVHAWLINRPIVDLLRDATDSAVKYVLDGARTWRFELRDKAVDSDERATVGTKLQYHVIEALGLTKEPPLDTTIAGVPVEIKGTVRSTWMIPREGQCEVTMLIQIDAKKHQFRASLMRTHRVWLTGGKGNRDLKRSPLAEAFKAFSLMVAPWTPLPPEPLRDLSPSQLEQVFEPGAGLRRRLARLFGFLPEVVIPRESIATVGAGLKDPMRRAREVKADVLKQHGMILLVGTWPAEREIALAMGLDISGEAWVAVPIARFDSYGLVPPPTIVSAP